MYVLEKYRRHALQRRRSSLGCADLYQMNAMAQTTMPSYSWVTLGDNEPDVAKRASTDAGTLDQSDSERNDC